MISSISTRSVRDWRSNEPGAWVIVLMPALSAFLVSGPTWNSAWLLALWCLCYCVQFSAARWAKSHGRARYRMPMLVYAALLTCAGLPFVFRFPGMLWWAPLYCVLCAGSLICAWRRREHSILANICAVLASSTMAIPVASLGAHGGGTSALAHLLPFDQSILPPLGVEIAGAYALTLFGSVLYVKTMIRERGNTRYLAASWIWHILVMAVGFLYSPLYGTLGAILLARAVVMPVATRNMRKTAKIVGIGECVTSLVSFAMITYAATVLIP